MKKVRYFLAGMLALTMLFVMAACAPGTDGSSATDSSTAPAESSAAAVVASSAVEADSAATYASHC